MSITVNLRFSAGIREAVGHGSESFATDARDAAGLRDALIARGEPYARVLARGKPVRIAVDQHMGDETRVLHDGAEVAFFPPVTGG